MILILSIIALVIEANQLQPVNLSPTVDKSPVFAKKELWISQIVILPLLFFLGFRDEVLDTYAYVSFFDSLQIDFNPSQIESLRYGYCFPLIARQCKTYISDTHYFWFFLLAAINLYCIVKICEKYSPNLAFSIYLFVAGTTFTWCLNGTRQFLAVTILFLLSPILVEGGFKKKLLYIIFVLLCADIHTSAIFLVPIILLVSTKKLYSKGMILVVIGTAICTLFSDSILGEAAEIMDKDYEEALESGTGTNIIRFLFVAITTGIGIIKYKTIARTAPPSIILGLNLSLAGACFMFAACFTNGILVGRMPQYFTIYNLFVIPWLVYNCFNSYRKFIFTGFIILYFMWFFYQMQIAWKGLPYISYILNIYA